MSKPHPGAALAALLTALLLLSANSASAQSGPVGSDRPPAPRPAPEQESPTGGELQGPDRPIRYLLLGDSMAWAIGVELEPRLEAIGHHFTYKSKISASIRGWGSGKHIKEQIQRYKPDAVIIVLGTNESQIPYPEHLDPPITRIIEAVGDRACYWIGPPTWRGGKTDTGVVALLEKHKDRCAFFDSMPLDLERRPDKIHPTREGSRTWAEAIERWLIDHPPAADKPAPE